MARSRVSEEQTLRSPELALAMECPENEKTRKQPTISYFKLFSTATALDYILMAGGTIGALAHGAALPLAVLLFGNIVESVGIYFLNPPKLYEDASKYCLDCVYVGIVTLAAAWLEVFCWTYTGERQASKIRVQYLRALLGQDIGFYDTDSTTGEIVVGISSDTLLVQDAIGEKVGNFIHNMARFAAGLAVSFTISWELTSLTLAVVPLIAIAGGVYSYAMIDVTTNSHKAYIKAGEIAEQVVAQVRSVYAYGGEDKAVRSYARALEKTVALGVKGGLAKGLGMGSVYLLLYFTWALLLWFAGRMVLKGTIHGGPAFVTILNAVIGGIAIGQAFPNLTAFGKGKAAGYTIFEMLRRSPVSRSRGAGASLSNVQGHIELKNIKFSYPSRPDAIIFQNFSLDIPAGKLVAIVGGSGSGKSTIISLIERFYDPQEGQVLLDGHNVRHLQLKWLRSQIGLVSQEPALFATTISENILFGMEEASFDDVIRAAKISGAHDFINQLPFKYDTQVGERGVQLSGGQKQRVALARAVLKDPAILLLDEATSALDSESEKLVQDALSHIMVGRTSVMIAHRLSTVQSADIITVMQNGKIVESGTHDQLLEQDGSYASLLNVNDDNGRDTSSNNDFVSSGRHSRASSLNSKAFSFRLSVQSDIESVGFPEPLSERKVYKKPSLKRLLQLNAPDWPYSLLGMLGAITAGGSMPLFVLGITEGLIAFYSITPGYLSHEIRKLSMLFIGAGTATLFFFVMEHYFFGLMGENVTFRVRHLMFSAILRYEVGWFEDEKNSSSLVASRLASDALMVKAAVGDLLCTLSHNLSLITTAFIVAFLLQWRIALVMISTFPFIVTSAVAQRQFLRGFGGDVCKAYLRANTVAGEAVGNIRTVAAFCAEEKVLQLFCKELQRPGRDSFYRGQIAGIAFGVSQCCMFCSYALTLWYGSYLIKTGYTSFGPMVKSFTVLLVTALGIAETLLLAPDIIEGLQSVGAVFEVLDRKTEIDPDDTRAEDVHDIRGSIQLKNVKFNYPSRPDVTIFENLNLKLGAGRSLALVGASGSGKSSIIALIARFYEPLTGSVLIDGKDIRRLRLRSLRKHIALVQQEPSLFSTSVYENILYGKDGATEAEVIEASKAANADSFISALPNGYATEVGERGVQLSGGQKQRVAIARAVLKNPAILLLDEATSALDAESERTVQDALDNLMKGRTTVVVAHRLSTIQHVDCIAVLEAGKIVEEGRHVDLLRKGGVYARLIRLQHQLHNHPSPDMQQEFLQDFLERQAPR
ncbi:hypothetical protein L7F22_016655 [Adiantum nelumboides]|nr:hypothetical protein [Adiantum nelumboides]